MRLHYFQHEPHEDLGSIGLWAESRGFSLSSTHFYKGETISVTLNDIDFLVVMGGSMNADEEAIYPWMAEEKAFIKAAIDAGKYVLGICIGAQLIARVLGAPVTKNHQKEIGWLPVGFTPGALALPLLNGFNETMLVFHWHGDTFALPLGAVRLASSEACANQGYLWKEKVLGLQFHMETTETHVRDFVKFGGAEIEAGGKYVQSAAALVDGMHHAPPMQRYMHKMLDQWLEKAPFLAK